VTAPNDAVHELCDDVEELMRLNDRIRDRLEIPHGWTPQQIKDHAKDVDDRALLEPALRAGAKRLKERL
jgi:hypothetical protein